MKTWRRIGLGPVSIVFRFRKTVRVSPSFRSARRRLTQFVPSQLLVPPRLGASFFLEPKESGVASEERRSGELAIIFGVGPGFGHAMARKLVSEDLTVALVSREERNLRDITASLNLVRDECALAYSCDATDERGVSKVFKEIVQQHGVPSLVIFSMQNSTPDRAVDMEVDAFEDCWRTNCLAGFIVARQAAREMLPLGYGSILLVGSTSALLGRENHLSLAVGKFGLRATAQVMARELWKQGIHVAHVVIDADIREPGNESNLAQSDPVDIADVIYSVHRQPRSAWTSEVDIRPFNEKFWEHC